MAEAVTDRYADVLDLGKGGYRLRDDRSGALGSAPKYKQGWFTPTAGSYLRAKARYDEGRRRFDAEGAAMVRGIVKELTELLATQIGSRPCGTTLATQSWTSGRSRQSG